MNNAVFDREVKGSTHRTLRKYTRRTPRNLFFCSSGTFACGTPLVPSDPPQCLTAAEFPLGFYFLQKKTMTILSFQGRHRKNLYVYQCKPLLNVCASNTRTILVTLSLKQKICSGKMRKLRKETRLL